MRKIFENRRIELRQSCIWNIYQLKNKAGFGHIEIPSFDLFQKLLKEFLRMWFYLGERTTDISTEISLQDNKVSTIFFNFHFGVHLVQLKMNFVFSWRRFEVFQNIIGFYENNSAYFSSFRKSKVVDPDKFSCYCRNSSVLLTLPQMGHCCDAYLVIS